MAACLCRVPPYYKPSSIYSINTRRIGNIQYRPLTRQGDQNVIQWAACAQFRHRHAMLQWILYSRYCAGTNLPDKRGRNASRLHYNLLTRQRQCFQRIQTPSLPIQNLFRRTVMGLVTPLLCEAGESHPALRRVTKGPAHADLGHGRWPAVSINQIRSLWPRWGRFRGRIVARTCNHHVIKAPLQFRQASRMRTSFHIRETEHWSNPVHFVYIAKSRKMPRLPKCCRETSKYKQIKYNELNQ